MQLLPYHKEFTINCFILGNTHCVIGGMGTFDNFTVSDVFSVLYLESMSTNAIVFVTGYLIVQMGHSFLT
jgi:hypothetical protein